MNILTLYDQQAYDNFIALADRASSVPKLKSPKRYSNYALEDSEWELLALIANALKVMFSLHPSLVMLTTKY